MRRFNIVPNGYDPKEVNEFIDMIIKRMEKVLSDNADAEREIEALRAKTKDSTDMENKLNRAIMAVQETSDKMKELARTESGMIIEEAKRNANAIVHEALVNAEKTEFEASMLRKNITVYKNKVKSTIQAQLELCDDLDKVEL